MPSPWQDENSGNRFGDGSGADAAGANTPPSAGSLDLDPHGLKVGLPHALGHIVGVTHLVTESGSLAANCANPRHAVSLRFWAEEREL